MNPFDQSDQSQDEDQVLRNITDMIKGIKSSKMSECERLSNLDSNPSKHNPIDIESGQNLNSTSLKAGNKLSRHVSLKPGELTTNKRQLPTSSFEGIASKKKKVVQARDKTVRQESKLLSKQKTLSAYFKLKEVEKVQQSKVTNLDLQIPKERGSQNKRRTDQLAEKLTQVSSEMSRLASDTEVMLEKLNQMDEEIQLEQIRNKEMFLQVWKQLMKAQNLDKKYIHDTLMGLQNQERHKLKTQITTTKRAIQNMEPKNEWPEIRDNNVLEAYEHGRKVFLKEINNKMITHAVSVRRLIKPIGYSTTQKLPAILDLSEKLIKDRFLFGQFKYTNNIGEDQYQVLDVDTMRLCLCRVEPLNFAYKTTFTQYMQKAVYAFTKSQLLKNSLYLDPLDLIEYHLEQKSAIIILSQLQPESNTLCELLETYKGFGQESAKYIMKKVCGAVHYVIQKGEFPCESVVTPSNVVIRYGDVKVCHYGFGDMKRYKPVYNQLHKRQNRFYYPPEFFRNPLAEKVATWSFGILFYECIYGKRPFDYDPESLKMFSFVQQLIFPSQPEVSENAKSLIQRCLAPNQCYRPTMSQVHRYQYFYNSRI